MAEREKRRGVNDRPETDVNRTSNSVAEALQKKKTLKILYLNTCHISVCLLVQNG